MNPLAGGLLAFATVLVPLALVRGMRRAPTRRPAPWTAGGLRQVPAWRCSAARWRQRLAGGPHTETALARLLDDVGGTLRAGGSLIEALRHAAGTPSPAVAGIAAALARVDRGSTLAEALERWRVAAPDAPARLVATALTHAAVLGGVDPKPLEAVADTMRERVALRGELRTQAAPARASAAMLSALPPMFLIVVAAVDHGVRDVVLTTPLGWACLAVGLVLDAAGALWMAHIVTGASP